MRYFVIKPIRQIPQRWQRYFLHALQVLRPPGTLIAGGELSHEVNADRQLLRLWFAGAFQLCICVAITGQNKHHRPVTVPEDASKRLHIDLTGLRRKTGVRVNPDPSKLFRVPSHINLVVKEIRDGSIIKGDRHVSASLLDQDNICHEPRICSFSNPETTHFGQTPVTQVD